MEGHGKDKSGGSGGAGREVAGAENRVRESGREIRVLCFCSGIYRGLHDLIKPAFKLFDER
ncbi:hypothetical protein DEO72_LG5g3131 [Vigna unguiculata]|uniref:Uncharacterized protein n=1 Tax=Vigna unguiculata TaxID=3917 RepID=A0A4D6M197_VIGUN|nr:hypothetical protein DEO72_LG5g3131 [Vigna unguiculata]